MKRPLPTFWLILGALIAFSGAARAADEAPVEANLTIFNHAFDPAEMTLPAGKKIKLTITNKDASAAEFESYDLSREKVVPAKGSIYVYLGPLDAGTYAYFDDFHRNTTTGKITVQ